MLNDDLYFHNMENYLTIDRLWGWKNNGPYGVAVQNKSVMVCPVGWGIMESHYCSDDSKMGGRYELILRFSIGLQWPQKKTFVENVHRWVYKRNGGIQVVTFETAFKFRDIKRGANAEQEIDLVKKFCRVMAKFDNDEWEYDIEGWCIANFI